MKRLAFATTALAILLLASGCTASEPAPGDSADAPTAEPTHAIVFVSEEWTNPAEPATPEEAATMHGTGWRILAIDLASGEERVLAEESSATAPPGQPPALSPDGTQLLYGTWDMRPETNYVPHMSNFSAAMQLHLLDLRTGDQSDVCSATVRSFGWDGSDIVATTWRGAWLVSRDANGGVTYTSPPPNAVIRVSGSTVTTIVPEVPTPDDVDLEGDGIVRQLNYLGSDEGDLYFEEGPAGYYAFDSASSRVWRIRSGETSPTLALDLDRDSGWGATGGPYQSLPLTGFMASSMSGAWLAEGLLPTRQWYYDDVKQPDGSFRTEETSISVLVRRASDMQIERSFEMTGSTPFSEKTVFPVFDVGVTRWLDQRHLEPPTAPEAGMWLCETDAASLETTPVALMSADDTLGEALGYIGSDLNVLYTTGNNTFGSLAPRTLRLWDRSTGDSRELAAFEGKHELTNFMLAYVGGTVLE